MKYMFFVFFLFHAAAAQAQMLTQDSPKNPAPIDITAPVSTPKPETKNTSNEPLQITADEALEWRRNDKSLIARGNAVAKKGDASVSASTLTARYDEKKEGGGMKISNITAEGNVVIKSNESEARGSKAVYDLDKGYAVMTGGNLKMTAQDQIVTAREKFEYDVRAGKLIATGRAKVTRGQDTLEADTISAVMKDDARGQRKLETAEAKGNVVITTPFEKITGQYGIYRADTNKAEMKGGIKIIRGPNVLEGERAEVDLTTNTSVIFGNPGSQKRVTGIFYPDSKK
jgi:lipopolysaccharide export system protein LptA